MADPRTEHILSLQTNDHYPPNGFEPAYGAQLLTVYDRPPAVFEALLKRDAKLNDLWAGRSKPEGIDTSGSGYDISLIRRLGIDRNRRQMMTTMRINQ